MDLLTTLLVLAGGTLLYGRLVAARTGAAFEALGAGFLGYREAGWPRGVQEAEPVPWKWSSMSPRVVALDDGEDASDAVIDVIEISGPGGAELTAIDRGAISRGTSI